MGQQQLILLIVVILIVALATYLALDVFHSSSESAMLESVQSDLTSIAASAQSYYYKPAMIGGGGRSFEGIDFTKFSFSRNVDDNLPLTAENDNGEYTISDDDSLELIVTGRLNDQNERAISIRICPDSFQLGQPGEDNTAPEPPACGASSE